MMLLRVDLTIYQFQQYHNFIMLLASGYKFSELSEKHIAGGTLVNQPQNLHISIVFCKRVLKIFCHVVPIGCPEVLQLCEVNHLSFKTFNLASCTK